MSDQQNTLGTGNVDNPHRDVPLPLSMLVGALTMVATLGVWWVGYKAGLTVFPAFDLADRLIRAVPGDVATWAIANFQFRASDIALLGGIAAFITAGAAVGAGLRQAPGARTGAFSGFAGALLCVALGFANNTISGAGSAFGHVIWFGVTLAGLYALAGSWIERVHVDLNDSSDAPPDWVTMNGTRSRRQVLRNAGILALALGGGGWVAGLLARNAGLGVETADGVPLPERRAEIEGETEVALPTPLPAMAAPDSFDAPSNVRPRFTSNEEFYVIDINTRKPALPDNEWTLRIHGLVDQPMELTYFDLLNMPSVEQDGTLMCISYTYGSNLISTTRWTGVPLRDVMQMAGIQDSGVELVLRGAGGYSDSIPVSKALEAHTLLAYGMNGETLPRNHGFPCRLYVPNIYGEKNVKWLQEIEVVDYDYSGYWQERGWSDTAVVNIFSVIDTPSGSVTPDEGGSVPIGGVAFAGSRGIQNVRIRIDDGEWLDADVEPYDPELVWQRWRYDWQPEPGEYMLTCQAVDGTGALQETSHSDPYPDGMTGLQEVTVRVN